MGERNNHHPHHHTEGHRQHHNGRQVHHDSKTDHAFRRILHYIERFIAAVTLIILVGVLALELYQLVVSAINDVDSIHLHDILTNILTIVVGLEFVRMLIDTTPANILEVLTVAMTRHIILTHDDYWSNLVCVICIGGLFAIRRFLVRKNELKEEMVEIE